MEWLALDICPLARISALVAAALTLLFYRDNRRLKRELWELRHTRLVVEKLNPDRDAEGLAYWDAIITTPLGSLSEIRVIGVGLFHRLVTTRPYKA